jgi:hypothetical protein
MQSKKFFNVVAAAASNVQQYADSGDFMELFEAGHFDEELEADGHWAGLVRDEGGTLQVVAEFVYDDNADSGCGYWL